MDETLVSRLTAAQQELTAAQADFLAAWAQESEKPNLVFSVDEVSAAKEVEALAVAIMELVEKQCDSRELAGVALTRALAGFYARLALDFEEPAVVAAIGVLIAMTPTADLAARLVRQHTGEGAVDA